MVELAIWHQLLALALTKKVAAITVAYLYGIPRLYRCRLYRIWLTCTLFHNS